MIKNENNKKVTAKTMAITLLRGKMLDVLEYRQEDT